VISTENQSAREPAGIDGGLSKVLPRSWIRFQDEAISMSWNPIVNRSAGERMSKTINFYGSNDEFGCFSNFAPYPIERDGKLWPTSEHYFQAQKFAATEHEDAIRRANSPMIAARMGRDRKKPLRPDWESVKIEVMREAVRAKFQQHADLREILLATGDSLIVEHTEIDSFWGDGGDGSGKNMLGRILMEVREELRG
jgi:N-glycosidase YbiA